MSITFVRSAQGAAQTGTSNTISFDATGCDMLVVGARDTGTTQLITGVTYNGTPLTLARHDGTDGRGSSIYTLANPPSGVHNVVITYSGGATNIGAIASGWSGNGSSIVVGNVAGRSDPNSGGSGTGPNVKVPITMSAGSVAVDFFVLTKGDSTVAPTPGGSQNSLGGMLESGGFCYDEASYLTDATQMSWSWNGPSVQPQAHSVIELRQGAADTIPPTLTSPTATATGSATASGTVSTNEATGTLFWIATANTTETAVTVKAGSSQAVTALGTQNVTVSGLTSGNTYRIHYLHRDAAGNDSAVVDSGTFTTTAVDAVPPNESGGVTFSAVSASGFTATWPAGTDNVAVVGYKYRLNGGAWTDAGVGTATSKTFSGLASSTPYTVDIEAVDGAGLTSPGFATGSTTTQAAAAPALSSYFKSVFPLSANFVDRVQDVTTGTAIGTGNFVFAGTPPTGFQAFSTAYANGTTRIPYACVNASGQWENGLGTQVSSTTFSRDTVFSSSNNNQPVNFGAGVITVYTDIHTAVFQRFRAKDSIDARDYPIDPTFTSDSTAAIQAVINDAFVSGLRADFPVGRYKIGGALKAPDDFGRGCNGQLYIPASQVDTNMRHVYLRGTAAPNMQYSALIDSPMVTNSGVIFESTLTPAQTTGTLPAVLYASQGYNTGYGVFSMTDVTLKNIVIRTNASNGASSMCGFNAQALSNAPSFKGCCRIEVNRGLLTNPDPSALGSEGLICPPVNNSGHTKSEFLFVGGFAKAVRFSEHTHFDRLTIYGCGDGVTLDPAYHSSYIGHLNIEGCKNSIVMNGDHALHIGSYDTEHNSGVTWRAFANDIKYVSGSRKIHIDLSTVVKGGVGISDADWTTNATSANYKVVSGAGAN